MVLSNVIVDVTISRRSFVFGQSRAKVSAGFTKVSRQSQHLIFYRLFILLPVCHVLDRLGCSRHKVVILSIIKGSPYVHMSSTDPVERF